MRVKKKLFLVQGEFIVGEYSQNFSMVTMATNEQMANKKVNSYFKEYYGKGNLTDSCDFDYLYNHGEVRVKIDTIRESSPEGVVKSLSMI